MDTSNLSPRKDKRFITSLWRWSVAGATALLCAVGCAGASPDESGEPGGASEITATATSELLPTACGTTTAARTLTGTGAFNLDPPYGTTACSGYVVDINNYSTNDDYGTSVSYDGAVPTTKAACENLSLTVGVWEIVGTSRPKLGEVTLRGKWLTNPIEAGICRLPNLVVEKFVKTYRANNARDYKLVVSALEGTTKRRFSLATTKVRRPNIYAIDVVRDRINLLTGGAIDPSVHRVWQNRNTTTGQKLCRAAQIDITAMTFSKRSLTQAGVTTTTVDSWVSRYAAMRTALCTTGGNEATFQTATRDFFTAVQGIRTQLADIYWSSASNMGDQWGDFQMFSTMLVGGMMQHDLGLLLNNCNPSTAELYRYISAGTLPSGVAADRLLLGTCRNDSVGTVAGRLGVGGTLSPATARQTLDACIAQSADPCNDPRANGTSEDAPDAGADTCMHTPPGGGTPTPCTTPEQNQAKERDGIVIMANEKGEALSEEEIQEYLRNNPNAVRAKLVVVPQQKRERIELDEPFPKDTATGRMGNAIIEDIDAKGEDISPIYHTLKQAYEEFVNWVLEPSDPGPTDLLHNPPGCELTGQCHEGAWPPDQRPSNYCPPDWAAGGWYGTSNGDFSNGQAPRQMHQNDRFQHCLCETMDLGYTATGNAIRSTMCPTQRERVAQRCLVSQWGPDQPIPPECLDGLEPAQVDNADWMARICQRINCPANQRGVVVDTTKCGCEPLTTPAVGDLQGEQCRRRGWTLRCEEGTDCVCGPTGYDLPFNDPSCLNDPTTFPGPLSRIATPSPDRIAVFVDPRTPDDRFLGAIDRSTTQSQTTSMVLPATYRNTLVSVGTGVSTKVLTTETMASGTLQLYLHNLANNVHHEFAAQCELQTLAAGAPTTCNLTPNNSQRQTKWNDCFRSGACSMEFTVQGTNAPYNGIVGFTAPKFIGTLTPVGGTPPRICPRPNPIAVVRGPNPLWQSAGGTPAAPNVDLILGTGAGLRLPTTTFTIDPALLDLLNPR